MQKIYDDSESGDWYDLCSFIMIIVVFVNIEFMLMVFNFFIICIYARPGEIGWLDHGL